MSDTNHLDSRGRWINNCVWCPHIEYRETYVEYISYCSKKESKKIENTFPIPDWCPLGHKTVPKSYPKESL